MSRQDTFRWTVLDGILTLPKTKMGYFYLLTTALLFFVLTPGVVLSLPPGGSKMVVAATHAVVFAIVHKLLHMYLY